MLNPFGSEEVPGFSSYSDLKKRITQKVQASNVKDQIFQAVLYAFENALGSENPLVPHDHPERKRLFSQVLKSVLEDMLNKLDKKSSA